MDNETPEWWKPYRGRFPGWHAWLGVNDMFYARFPKSSPPIVLVARSPEQLKDTIIRRMAR
jgi:hypothetical protein